MAQDASDVVVDVQPTTTNESPEGMNLKYNALKDMHVEYI